MGRKSAARGTVAYFAETGAWVVVCEICGHRTAFDARKLVDRFGWTADIRKILLHFRCRKCGAREPVVRPGI